MNLNLDIYLVSVGIVVAYSILGWLTMTGIKLNYGRLQNSFVKILINPKLSWFLF
jgi:hypothetical protein